MPLADDKKRLPEELDRRRKIPRSERPRIKSMYESKLYSMRELANLYGVSKRLIQFIVYPERDKELKARVKAEKRWLKYYDKDKHKLAIRRLRAHKKLNRVKLILSTSTRTRADV